MQIKSVKLLSIIVMILTAMILVSGCGKSGERFANIAPTITITSFEGWDNTYAPAGYDTTMTYAFQQTIYWHANDPDGVITGYAFRVLDNSGNPVAVPGYSNIDLNRELTPPQLPGSGWVIHYLPGADQSIPLSDPSASRTIWTSQKYAVINFPSADANGNPIVSYSRFEVVAIDNHKYNGTVGAISNIAYRDFRTNSVRPTCTISTTKGNPNGKRVGTGLKLAFSMKDHNPFIDDIPYKYEFQMMKTDTLGINVIPGTQTEWFSTIGSDNLTAKVNEYLLTAHTSPGLTADYDANNQAFRQTRITARVTDLAGVVSVPDTNTVISFKVREGFRPKSLVYPTKTYALGNNHFEDWGDDSTVEVLPSSTSSGSIRYASPFFKDMDGKLSAVYSQNLKVWIRWGWWGEYGMTAGESTIYVEDPYAKKVDVVLDRTTNENYFSEITHFDLRYDGEPYNFPPFANSIVTDNNGDRWLRIPTNSPLGQTVVLTSGQLPVPPGSAPGRHEFQIRVVDLQGEVDPNPFTFEFYLHNYIAPADRNGILIIDDDVHQATYAPDTILDDKYDSMISDYTGIKTVITRLPDPENGLNPMEDIRGRALAFSDLQKYKLVIYHSDNSTNPGNLSNDVDGLSLFMQRGGNLVISHTHLLSSEMENVAKNGARLTLLNNLGFTYSPYEPMILFPNRPNPANWYFFQSAVPEAAGYPTVNLQFNDPPSFNSIVESRKGLATVAYFSLFTGQPIYSFGCKPVNYDLYPPTQAQFDALNGKPVGMRVSNSNNSRAYVFGFPLSYMMDADSKAMMNKILSEVM